MSIFNEQLRRNWRQMLYWTFGLGLLSFLVMIIIPNADVLEQYADLLQSMPPFLMQAFGAQEVEALATPEGFIGLEFFSFVILLLAGYGVYAGMNIISNEEDNQILDIVLTLPIPRWRVILERYAAYALIVVVISIGSYLGLFIGKQFIELEVNMATMAAACFQMIPTVLAVMAFTVFVSGLTARRSIVIGVSSLFVIVSYFAYVLGNAASGTFTDALSTVSVFSYYDTQTIVQQGLQVGSVVLLLGVSLLLLGVSLVTFERRDVGV